MAGECLLRLSQVISFCDDHVKPIKEGSAILDCDPPRLKIGVLPTPVESTADKNVLQIRGICLSASKKNEPPYKIDINLSANGAVFIRVHCTCKGGASGKCKHCVVALITLTR